MSISSQAFFTLMSVNLLFSHFTSARHTPYSLFCLINNNNYEMDYIKNSKKMKENFKIKKN